MTTRHWAIFWSFALLLITTPAVASLRDIRADKLPQEESIQKAYAEAASVEEFADAWSDNWRYETPKDVVTARLKDSLDKLQKAAVSAPDNSELFLLTGLVAHYAYNVDVEGAYELAVSSLRKAQTLAPNDYRAEWFLGNHECQAGGIKEGMEFLLAVESRSAWDHLPPAFWDDYLYCASLANMPAHLLRAGDHLSKLHAPLSETRSFLMDVARKRFQTPDPNSTYPSKEVWETATEASRLVFKSSMCGFSFSPLGEWKLRRLEAEKGSCKVLIETGPYPSKVGDITPILIVLARQAKPGETLADFMRVSMRAYPSPQAVAVSHCPSDQCLAFEAAVPGHYAISGDDRYTMIAFKRDAPEFPGLLFEEPAGPPDPKDEKVSVFHPKERLHRLDGTLYYLVVLDTADFVLDASKKDYDRLLKYLQAE